VGERAQARAREKERTRTSERGRESVCVGTRAGRKRVRTCLRVVRMSEKERGEIARDGERERRERDKAKACEKDR